MLGYELAQVSVGTVTRGAVAGSKPARCCWTGDGHEVRVGDRLIPVDAQPYDLQFFPHLPKAPAADTASSECSAVADALTSAVRATWWRISGGSRDGIDNGTVFSIWRQGSNVIDCRIRDRGHGTQPTRVPSAGGSDHACPTNMPATSWCSAPSTRSATAW